MISCSDQGRIQSAPDPVQEPESSTPPRSRMVVEDFVPDYPPAPQFAAQQSSLAVSRGGGNASRARVMTVVAGLHALVAAWLVTSLGAQRVTHPAATAPLLLLDRIPPPDQAAVVPPDLPSPDEQPVPLARPAVPKLPRLAQGPAEIAISISASTDVMISDANADEVARTFGACVAGAPDAKPLPSVPDLTLLARVEKDGRVSDSKVEVGSGAQRVDEAAQRCLLAHGQLSPHRLNGEPIASWQRVRWSARALQAHT